ncbi:MAG: ribbon-helix-helix domain-containing protein [Myxococcaceae bacterium]
MDASTLGITSQPSTVSDTKPAADKEADVVSTHVLVAEDQVEKLRELSRRTRVAQSEYLREAVDDLLAKYRKLGNGQ